MEKKTFDLCMEVLRRFEKAGILKHLILIGSWSIYFYKYYFNSKEYSTFIRTKDIDFLVPIPPRFNSNITVFDLLKDLGFIEEHKGSKGYLKLEHPDLTVEFLVPERGRGHNKPYLIPQLGINAVPLRFLDFLITNTIAVNAEGSIIRLPDPAAYALHKFIVFKRRRKIDKHDRDIEGAIRVFRELSKNNKIDSIKTIFNKMHKKWREKIIANLKSIDEPEIVEILKGT
ncbi:MAG: GSU2403 family nucleotidyltransferase fold protein [Candidatus Omnitrophica bacterium]|nr:GSU2403 family nucleotidyltransferase fold protein [Candidatus Omnitrophota bacterium]